MATDGLIRNAVGTKYSADCQCFDNCMKGVVFWKTLNLLVKMHIANHENIRFIITSQTVTLFPLVSLSLW